MHITVLNLPEASGCFNHETIVQEPTGKTFDSHCNCSDPLPSLFSVPVCCRIWLNLLWDGSFMPVFLLGFWRPLHSSSYLHLLAPSHLFVTSLSSGGIMQSLRQWTCRGYGSSILTPQTFNEHGCITILARRHYPGTGTGEQTIRVHAGAEAEVPKWLFKASSWIHMAKRSECSINYDRPDVPPALHPQCL